MKLLTTTQWYYFINVNGHQFGNWKQERLSYSGAETFSTFVVFTTTHTISKFKESKTTLRNPLMPQDKPI